MTTNEEIINAVEEATDELAMAVGALRSEREIRRWQIGLVAVVVLILAILVFFVYRADQDGEQQTCEAVNQTRGDTRSVLRGVFALGDDGRTDAERKLLDSLLDQIEGDFLQFEAC